MTTILILLVVSLIILVVYVGALLVFTPYEEDDKFLLKIIESGLKFHVLSLKKSPKIISTIEECLAKCILTMGYFILKDREYIDNKK